MYEEGRRKPLVVVGSINADLVIEVDRLPTAGETIAGDSLNVYPGGKVRATEHRADRSSEPRAALLASWARLPAHHPRRRVPTRPPPQQNWATRPSLLGRCAGGTSSGQRAVGADATAPAAG